MSWLFGSKQDKERKKALKVKEQAAYLRGYESAKIQSAMKRGKRAGSTTWSDRLSGLGAGLDFNADLFGIGPPRRKTHKKRKGKTIVIHVK